MLTSLLIFLLFNSGFTKADSSCSSLGTNFVFGFTRNAPTPPDVDTLYVIVTNYNPSSATLTLTIPFLDQNSIFTVPGFGSQKITLPESLKVEGANGEFEIDQKGIRLTSTLPVRVYAANEETDDGSSIDGTAILPVSSLGNNYVTVTYTRATRYPNQLMVVATQDDTIVSFSNGVFSSTEQKTISTLGVASYSLLGSDLTGVHVTANKPIAVLSGSSCGYGDGSGGCDYGVTMLHPSSCWGIEFVAKPLAYAANGNVIHISAAQFTIITINNGGSVQTQYINAFSDFTFTITQDSWAYITSSNPIQVTQEGENIGDLNGYNRYGDPSLSQVLSANQFARGTIMFTTIGSFQESISGPYLHFVNLITRTSNIYSMILDGSSVSDWSLIGETGFSGKTVQITNGTHTVTCLGYCSFYGLAHGYSRKAGYSFEIGSGGSASTTTSATTTSTATTFTSTTSVATPKPTSNPPTTFNPDTYCQDQTGHLCTFSTGPKCGSTYYLCVAGHPMQMSCAAGQFYVQINECNGSCFLICE